MPPQRNSSIEERKKYRHSKTTCPDRCHLQKDYATKTSPQAVYESRITLRNNSKVGRLERYETYVQGHRVLYGTLAKKKGEVRFRKYVGALLKKQASFQKYRTWRRKCFNNSERCSF